MRSMPSLRPARTGSGLSEMSERETPFATGLSILALCLSLAALAVSWQAVDRGPSMLVYDPDHVSAQIGPYIEAGQDPIAVIDTAVQRAVARGFILVDARLEIRAPDTARLRLQDFVAVGDQIPFHSSRTEVNPSSNPPHLNRPTALPRSDVRGVARQIYGSSGAYTPAPESQ